MESVLVVLCIAFTLVTTASLYFCYKVITLINKEKIIQHQIFEPQAKNTVQTLPDNDTISPLDEQSVPLDQFTPDLKKPIKVTFEDSSDDYTEDI